MADGGDGGREDQAGPDAAYDPEDDEEVPVCRADAEEEVGRHQEDAAGEDEPAGALGVEDGADLDAAEEGEEGVDAEDPADGAVALGL